MITEQEERIYLGDFHARGSGGVRGGEAANVKASWEDHDLVVKMTHSKHGTISVRFVGVEIGHARRPYWSDEDDALPPEQREEALREDARAIVEMGTWELNLDERYLSVHRESFMGYSYARISFEDIVLDLPESVPEDGRCRACGSEEFVLSSFGSQRLKVTGPYTFESTAPATLSIHNASPRIACASCRTDHASSGTFNGGFVIDGRSNRREDMMRPVVSDNE